MIFTENFIKLILLLSRAFQKIYKLINGRQIKDRGITRALVNS